MSIPRLPALPVPAPRGSARPRGPARRFTATPRRLRLIAALAFAAIVLRLPACAQADKATSEALEGYFDFVDAHAGVLLPQQIPAEDCRRFHVLDVRGAAQFAREHLPGAVNIEWADRSSRAPER